MPESIAQLRSRAKSAPVRKPALRRAVVVGLGSAGRRHAQNLLSLGLDVEAVSEWRKLQKAEVEGVPLRITHSLEQALASRPDIVVIATPTSLHARDAAAALNAGCHVYVEKPLAETAKAARPLVALARRRRRVLAVGCQLRFNACLGRLKALLEHGRLGRIIHAQAVMGEYLPAYHPEEDYRDSYASRAALGGGILLTQIHELNYLHWLFGSFESVCAVGGKTSDLEIDVEDNVSLLLRTPKGLAVSAHMDFLQRPRRRALTVAGEQGTAAWDYDRNTLTVTGPDGKPEELGPQDPLDRNRMFLDAMNDFLRCAAAGGHPRTDAVQGLADVRLADAARASMARGRVERIR